MKKVLILDDDQIYLSLLGRAIRMEKLEPAILLASGAEEFRQQVESEAANLGVVVLDINLRDQENGFDLLEWLRRALPNSPIKAFMQSSTCEPADRQRALALNSELRTKVNSFAQLRQSLQDFLCQANAE